MKTFNRWSWPNQWLACCRPSIPFALSTRSLTVLFFVLSPDQQSYWPNNPNEDVKPYNNISLNNGAIPFYNNGNGVENGVANQNSHLAANGMCIFGPFTLNLVLWTLHPAACESTPANLAVPSFAGTNYNLENHGVGQLNKTIASSSLRLLNFVAYLELSHHPIENTAGNQQLQLALNDSTNSEKIDFKHIFVEITGEPIYGAGNSNLINSSAEYSQLEDIDIKQIWDKFSQNKNGLRDLYDKGEFEQTNFNRGSPLLFRSIDREVSWTVENRRQVNSLKSNLP